MSILKALFGTKEENQEEKRKEESARQFDVFKYDGVRALKSRQPAYAVECLTRAIEINEDLECRDYLSQALVQTGDLAEAYEQLRVLASTQPDNQLIFMRMADVSFMREDYAAMSDDCEKAMAIDDTNPQAYLLYARACHGQGDDANAEAMLTKAIALKEDFYDAYLMRGELLMRSGRIEEADNDVRRLMADLDGNEDVLLLAARVEMAKNNIEAAANIYNNVLDADPFSIPALRERAAAEFTLGRKEDAEADLKAAAELEGNSGGESAAEPFDMEQQVKQIYRNIDPYGLFSHI